MKFCLYSKSFAESACLAKTQVKRMLQNGNGFVRVFFQRNGLPTTNLFYVSDIALVAKDFAVAKLCRKVQKSCRCAVPSANLSAFVRVCRAIRFFAMFVRFFTEFCLTNVVLFVVKLLILQ